MRSDAADNRGKPARSPHVARRNAPPANAAAEASALLRLAFGFFRGLPSGNTCSKALRTSCRRFSCTSWMRLSRSALRSITLSSSFMAGVHQAEGQVQTGHAGAAGLRHLMLPMMLGCAAHDQQAAMGQFQEWAMRVWPLRRRSKRRLPPRLSEATSGSRRSSGSSSLCQPMESWPSR